MAGSFEYRRNQRGEAMPDGVVLGWPSADLTGTAPSLDANEGRDILRRGDLGLAIEAYLGDHDPTDPLVSAIFADLSFLPPVLIQVGDRDLLLDDSRALARRLEASGVPCRLDIWPDMVHAWAAVGEWFPEAKRAVADAGAWVAERFDAVPVTR